MLKKGKSDGLGLKPISAKSKFSKSSKAQRLLRDEKVNMLSRLTYVE